MAHPTLGGQWPDPDETNDPLAECPFCQEPTAQCACPVEPDPVCVHGIARTGWCVECALEAELALPAQFAKALRRIQEREDEQMGRDMASRLGRGR